MNSEGKFLITLSIGIISVLAVTVMSTLTAAEKDEIENSTLSYPISYAEKQINITKGWKELDYRSGKYLPYYSRMELLNTSFVYINVELNKSIEFWKNHNIEDGLRLEIVNTIGENVKQLKGSIVRVTSVNVTEDWATASLGILDVESFNKKGSKYVETTNLVLNKMSGTWDGSMNGTKKYKGLIEKAPSKIVDRDVREKVINERIYNI